MVLAITNFVAAEAAGKLLIHFKNMIFYFFDGFYAVCSRLGGG
jgi:hypothetical protein